MTADKRRLALALALVVLVGFTIYSRCAAPRPYVWEAEEVHLLGADAYYHLRHARFSAEHFPRLQRWDVGTHFPTGQRARYAGLYDLTLAATSRVVALGTPSEQTLRRVMAVAPVALGALALLTLFGLVRGAAGSGAAIFACLVVTLYPGEFLTRTTLGFADHHAAEVLLFLLSAWSVVACCNASSKSASSLRRAAKILLRATPLVAFYFTWPGAPLVVLVFALAACVTLLAAAMRGVDPSRDARELASVGAAFVLAAGAIGIVAPDLVMNARLHPAQLGAMLASLCAPLLVGPAHRRPGRVGVPTVLALLFGSALLLWLSDLDLRKLLGPKTMFVQEHLPPTPRGFLRTLGWTGALGLAAPAVAVWRLSEDVRSRRSLLLAAIGFGWMCVSWTTHDYGYMVPPLAAALSALVLVQVVPSATARRPGWMPVALVILLVVPLTLGWHPPPWSTREQVASLALLDRGWEESMEWLARSTPAPKIPVDADVSPFGADFRYPVGAYGVASGWDFGNLVSSLGRRTPMVSQELSRQVAKAFLATDEQAALDLWHAKSEPGERVRYVIIDAETVSDNFAGMAALIGLDAGRFVETSPDGTPRLGPSYHQTHASRLYHGAGNGLRNLRLVYQSPSQSLLYYQLRALPDPVPGGPQQRFRLRNDAAGSRDDCVSAAIRIREAPESADDRRVYGARCAPTVRIFEIVPGLRVEGEAPAHTQVNASLALRSLTDGESITYRIRAQAGSDGHFVLVLPYATDRVAASAVVAEGPYRLSFDTPDGVALPDLELEALDDQIRTRKTLDLGKLEGTDE